MQVVNVAVYKFIDLDRLAERRERLRALCDRLRLRGTILLASEGLNMFVAGSRASIDELLHTLQADRAIGPLEVKESLTDYQPFSRMLVKVKREIIAFGVDVPAGQPAGDKISPLQLREWLDAGKPLTLLDTRNEFEVEVGTFEGAISPGIESFRDFPEVVDSFPDEWRERPMVTFCTGGIRCEKAAPYLREQGFRHVYQLDGGILKYFEQVGESHYRGDCFVFDHRVAVDAALRETKAALCYACQAVLTEEDQASPLYVVGECCPYCHRTDAEAMAASIRLRHEKLREFTRPLPGSQPYDNHRPVFVPSRCDEMPIIEFLSRVVPALTREQWMAAVAAGNVQRAGTAVGPQQRVTAGERYEHVIHNVVEPEVNADIEIVYEDAAIVVVNKPAPLPMHPSGRFNKNTLARLLEPLYLPERLRPAHRLDANTTGLVVLSRSRRIAGRLQPQFEQGTVEKIYLARVHGHPVEDDFSCDAAIADNPSAAGIRLLDDHGLPAETRFRVVARHDDGTALVEARPITGRTNQIRLHLWSLGHPIVGDPTYLPDAQYAATQSLGVDDPPMCLHAWRLTFEHPISRDRVGFKAEVPRWL